MKSSGKIGTLWLIGCGNMGSALLALWAASGIAERIVVIDPAPSKLPEGVRQLPRLPLSGESAPDIVVLAVKPQIAPAALAGLPGLITPRTLAVSIMAGLPISAVAALTGAGRVVRAMPNTPAAVGKGVTALYLQDDDADGRAAAEALFGLAGSTVWLESESQFDAVTAVSGSGPAYVFRFIEAFTAAAEAAGLPAPLAETLARATVVGAAALSEADPRSAAALRQAVTSPGGTTEAGLEMLDVDHGLPKLLRDAVRAAAARSRELSEST